MTRGPCLGQRSAAARSVVCGMLLSGRRLLATNRRFDHGDVDLLHRHHGIEGPLGGGAVGAGVGPGQRDGGNLPGDAPLVLAPAALDFLAAVADDRLPVAVGLGLVLGGHLERERLVVLDAGPTVKPQAGNAHHGELNGQDITLLARRVVSRRAVDRTDGGVGKGPGVEPRRLLGIALVPEANRVLGNRRHRHLHHGSRSSTARSLPSRDKGTATWPKPIHPCELPGPLTP